MTIRWSNGGPQRLISRLEEVEPALNDVADEIVAETLVEAKDLQIETLRAAITMTGLDRMRRGRGNGPGRDDTGELIADVITEQTTEGSRHIGVWGWFDPDKKVFRQESTAHSIYVSFIQTRERFRARVQRASTKGF